MISLEVLGFELVFVNDDNVFSYSVFDKVEHCIVGVVADFLAGEEYVVNSVRERDCGNVLAEFWCPFFNEVYVEHTVATHIIVGPLDFIDSAAATHDEDWGFYL